MPKTFQNSKNTSTTKYEDGSYKVTSNMGKVTTERTYDKNHRLQESSVETNDGKFKTTRDAKGDKTKQYINGWEHEYEDKKLVKTSYNGRVIRETKPVSIPERSYKSESGVNIFAFIFKVLWFIITLPFKIIAFIFSHLKVVGVVVIVVAIIGGVGFGIFAIKKQFTVYTYDITYNLDGSINNIGNPDNFTNKSSKIELMPVTKEGYLFVGWYDESYINKIETISADMAQSVNLYAKWEELFVVKNGVIVETAPSASTNKYFTSVTIPTTYNQQQILGISPGVFEDCVYLTKVIFDEGVNIQNIPQNVFKGCQNIQEVYYNNSLQDYLLLTFENQYSNAMCYGAFLYIQSEPFEGFSYVETVNDYAFYGCKNEINISDVSQVGNYAFYNCDNLIRAKYIVSMGVSAFESCDNMKVVTFYKTTRIENSAFKDCVNLLYLDFPRTLQTIGEKSFYGCTDLELFYFTTNSSLNKIESYAFYNCSSLSIIILPDSLQRIERYAFYCEDDSVWGYNNQNNLRYILFQAVSDLYYYHDLSILEGNYLVDHRFFSEPSTYTYTYWYYSESNFSYEHLNYTKYGDVYLKFKDSDGIYSRRIIDYDEMKSYLEWE